MKWIITLIVATLTLSLSAQNQTYSFTIVDNNDKLPISFARVKSLEKGKTQTSNIDGFISIKTNSQDTLLISYMGYQSLKVPITNLTDKVYLIPAYKELSETVIFPGENPALRIIRLVQKNKKNNAINKYDYYAYKSYNKFYVNKLPKDSSIKNLKNAFEISQEDTLKSEEKQTEKSKEVSVSFGFGSKNNKDSVNETDDSTKVPISIDSFFKKQHLFISESITKSYFKKPQKEKDIVEATKVSGTTEPLLALLGAEFNKFNIYDDDINVGGSVHLSPIAFRAIKKYDYLIQDTLYDNLGDTIFIISYKPKDNTIFSGFQGELHINSRGFAIQEFTAKNNTLNSSLDYKITQKHSDENNGKWFPKHIRAIYYLSTISENDIMVGVGNSYIGNVSFDTLTKKDVRFNGIATDFAPESWKKTDEFWDTARTEPLDLKDSTTYSVIDSFSKEKKLQQKLDFLFYFLDGYIPIKFVNFEWLRTIQFNGFEGLRLNLAGHTNDRLSKYYSIGGYGGYGFNDKRFKYGGSFNLKPKANDRLSIILNHSFDILEPGGTKYYSEKPYRSVDNLNWFFTNQHSYIRDYSASIVTRFPTYYRWDFNVSHQKEDFNLIPFYIHSGKELQDINITEVSAGVKFIHKEKFINRGGKLYSFGSEFPTIQFKIAQAIPSLSSENIVYTRLSSKIEYTRPTTLYGVSRITLVASKLIGEAPVTRWFNATPVGFFYNVHVPNAFLTMPVNTFFVKDLAALYFEHDFKNIKIGENFKPKVTLLNNMGISSSEAYSQALENSTVSFRTFDKGYFESGIGLRNLFNSGFSSLGIAAVYRYGAYNTNNTREDFSIRLISGFMFN
jgi:hypothetical protein